MSYIGTQQGTAAPVLLDAITVVNNQAAYTMQKGGVNYSPASTLVMQVSLNGIIQSPNSSYTINGSTITFDSALVTGDVIDYILVREPTTGTIAPVDGSVTDSKIVSMAASKLTGALPAIDGSSLTGISSNAGSEYFQVNLTTDVTGLTSNTAYAVDFGGSGTVEYDTASNFDSANDAYLLDSSNGVYMISYSVGLKSPTITSERFISAAAVVHVATDGSTFSPYKATAEQLRGDAGDDPGSVILNNSFIYKATTATTKIKLFAHALVTSSQSWHIGTQSEDMVQGTATELNGAEVTFLSVMRIA